MIKSEVTGNKVLFYLSGDLDAENHKSLSVSEKALEAKNIQLINDGIKNWNTDFVVLLYKLLKKIPLNNIEFIDIPDTNELTFTYIADEENQNYIWKAIVKLVTLTEE